MTADRKYDVVLFGATGFVGRLIARYLVRNAPKEVRIALAGRSQAKLLSVRNQIGDSRDDVGIEVVDSLNSAQVRALAEDASVIISSVGPYAKYGMPLVEACVAAGTHYADLTGEVLFMRETIDHLHGAAQDSGARIVHTCGFDSIPSDLGVQMLAAAVREAGAGGLGRTVLSAKLLGGFSGGTLDSMRNQLDEVAGSPAKQRVVEDPYSLSPNRAAEPSPGDGPDSTKAVRDPLLGTWTAPFVMSPINTRVVRRSNALQDWVYGRRLRYQEVVEFGSHPAGAVPAHAMAGALMGLARGLQIPPTRKVLDRVLPKPGNGPSEWMQNHGKFRMEITAETDSGVTHKAVFAGHGDPGYAATSVMFAQSGLCLALDAEKLSDRFGVLTPATAMGTVLLNRLRASGFDARVLPLSGAPAGSPLDSTSSGR